MSTKQELHQLVDTLSDQNAADVLDFIHWLIEEPETLMSEVIERVHQGDDQIARGEFTTLDELRRDLGL